MTLDQMLMESSRVKRLEKKARSFRWYMAAQLSTVTLILVGFLSSSSPAVAIVYVVAVSLAGRFLIRSFQYQRASEKLGAAVDKHVQSVPLRLQIAANELYGKDGQLAAIECYESHVFGDCPLCGAQ